MYIYRITQIPKLEPQTADSMFAFRLLFVQQMPQHLHPHAHTTPQHPHKVVWIFTRLFEIQIWCQKSTVIATFYQSMSWRKGDPATKVWGLMN